MTALAERCGEEFVAQILLIVVCVVAVGVMTLWTVRLISALRSRERVADRLGIDDC